jgi:uncharacterized protein
MGYAVAHFYANGGSHGVVMRAIATDAVAAKLALPPANGITITLTACSRGVWANGVETGASRSGIFVEVVPATVNPNDRFTLVICGWAPGTGSATMVSQETWSELVYRSSLDGFLGWRYRGAGQLTGGERGAEDSQGASAVR